MNHVAKESNQNTPQKMKKISNKPETKPVPPKWSLFSGRLMVVWVVAIYIAVVIALFYYTRSRSRSSSPSQWKYNCNYNCNCNSYDRSEDDDFVRGSYIDVRGDV